MSTDGRQRFWGRFVADLAAVAFGAGETGFDQRLEMLHDRLAGEGGVLGQPRGRVGALLHEPFEQHPSRRDRRVPRTDRRAALTSRARSPSCTPTGAARTVPAEAAVSARRCGERLADRQPAAAVVGRLDRERHVRCRLVVDAPVERPTTSGFDRVDHEVPGDVLVDHHSRRRPAGGRRRLRHRARRRACRHPRSRSTAPRGRCRARCGA